MTPARPEGGVEGGPLRRRLPGLLLAAYALAILSIGITKDWRLLHEDNGAFHATLALSHLRLGLAETRGHNFFVDPHSGAKTPYGHHPPGFPLLVAAAMRLTGSEEPWLVRSVPIAFQLASVFLVVALLSTFFGRRLALLGGFLFATLPMGAYFGRMPNFEAPGLFAALVMLVGWARYRLTGSRRAAAAVLAGVVLAGLIDYGPLFFGAAIGVAEVIRWVRERRGGRFLLALAACGAGVVLFDAWHVWYANHGSFQPFLEVLAPGASPAAAEDMALPALLTGLLEFFRRYFTHAGLIASGAAFAALLAPRARFAAEVFDGPEPEALKRTMRVAGGAALAYVAAAPAWARVHPYWQFYFLPFVVASLILLARFLLRRLDETGKPLFRVMLAVLAVEIVATSAYMLHLRHTRVGAYAVDMTEEMRRLYLVR